MLQRSESSKNDDKGFSRWRKREREKERKKERQVCAKKQLLALSSNGPRRTFGWAQVVTVELVFYLAISETSCPFFGLFPSEPCLEQAHT